MRGAAVQIRPDAVVLPTLIPAPMRLDDADLRRPKTPVVRLEDVLRSGQVEPRSNGTYRLKPKPSHVSRNEFWARRHNKLRRQEVVPPEYEDISDVEEVVKEVAVNVITAGNEVSVIKSVRVEPPACEEEGGGVIRGRRTSAPEPSHSQPRCRAERSASLDMPKITLARRNCQWTVVQPEEDADVDVETVDGDTLLEAQVTAVLVHAQSRDTEETVKSVRDEESDVQDVESEDSDAQNNNDKDFSIEDIVQDISADEINEEDIDTHIIINAEDINVDISADDINLEAIDADSIQNIDEGVSAQELDEGVIAQDIEEGVSAQDTEEGVSAQDIKEGVSVQDIKEGVSAPDIEEGMSAQDIEEGMSAQDIKEGVSAQDIEEGMSAQDIKEGVSAQDIEGGMSTQDIKEGVSAQDIEEGMSAQDIKEGVSAQDIEGGMSTQDIKEGVSAQDIEEGVSAQEVEEGVSAQDIEEGVSAQEAEEGVSAQDIEEGVSAQEVEEGVKAQDIENVEDVPLGVEEVLVTDSCVEHDVPDVDVQEVVKSPGSSGSEPKKRGRPPKSISKVNGGVDTPKKIGPRKSRHSRRNFRHDSIHTFKPNAVTPPWRFKNLQALRGGRSTSPDPPSSPGALTIDLRAPDDELDTAAFEMSTRKSSTSSSMSAEEGKGRRRSVASVGETSDSNKSHDSSRDDEDGNKRRRKRGVAEIAVQLEVDAQIAKSELREKRQRISQDLPGFNWLEEKYALGRKMMTSPSKPSRPEVAAKISPTTPTDRVMEPRPDAVIVNMAHDVDPAEARRRREEAVRGRVEAPGLNGHASTDTSLAAWGFSNHVVTMARHTATSFDTGQGAGRTYRPQQAGYTHRPALLPPQPDQRSHQFRAPRPLFNSNRAPPELPRVNITPAGVRPVAPTNVETHKLSADLAQLKRMQGVMARPAVPSATAAATAGHQMAQRPFHMPNLHVQMPSQVPEQQVPVLHIPDRRSSLDNQIQVQRQVQINQRLDQRQGPENHMQENLRRVQDYQQSGQRLIQENQMQLKNRIQDNQTYHQMQENLGRVQMHHHQNQIQDNQTYRQIQGNQHRLIQENQMPAHRQMQAQRQVLIPQMPGNRQENQLQNRQFQVSRQWEMQENQHIQENQTVIPCQIQEIQAPIPCQIQENQLILRQIQQNQFENRPAQMSTIPLPINSGQLRVNHMTIRHVPGEMPNHLQRDGQAGQTQNIIPNQAQQTGDNQILNRQQFRGNEILQFTQQINDNKFSQTLQHTDSQKTAPPQTRVPQMPNLQSLPSDLSVFPSDKPRSVNEHGQLRAYLTNQQSPPNRGASVTRVPPHLSIMPYRRPDNNRNVPGEPGGRGRPTLGRNGWMAEQPILMQQNPGWSHDWQNYQTSRLRQELDMEKSHNDRSLVDKLMREKPQSTAVNPTDTLRNDDPRNRLTQARGFAENSRTRVEDYPMYAKRVAAIHEEQRQELEGQRREEEQRRQEEEHRRLDHRRRQLEVQKKKEDEEERKKDEERKQQEQKRMQQHQRDHVKVQSASQSLNLFHFMQERQRILCQQLRDHPFPRATESRPSSTPTKQLVPSSCSGGRPISEPNPSNIASPPTFHLPSPPLSNISSILHIQSSKVSPPIHIQNTVRATAPIQIQNTSRTTAPIQIQNTVRATAPIHIQHTVRTTAPIHIQQFRMMAPPPPSKSTTPSQSPQIPLPKVTPPSQIQQSPKPNSPQIQQTSMTSPPQIPHSSKTHHPLSSQSPKPTTSQTRTPPPPPPQSPKTTSPQTRTPPPPPPQSPKTTTSQTRTPPPPPPQSPKPTTSQTRTPPPPPSQSPKQTTSQTRTPPPPPSQSPKTTSPKIQQNAISTPPLLFPHSSKTPQPPAPQSPKPTTSQAQTPPPPPSQSPKSTPQPPPSKIPTRLSVHITPPRISPLPAPSLSLSTPQTKPSPEVNTTMAHRHYLPSVIVVHGDDPMDLSMPKSSESEEVAYQVKDEWTIDLSMPKKRCSVSESEEIATPAISEPKIPEAQAVEMIQDEAEDDSVIPVAVVNDQSEGKKTDETEEDQEMTLYQDDCPGASLPDVHEDEVFAFAQEEARELNTVQVDIATLEVQARSGKSKLDFMSRMFQSKLLTPISDSEPECESEALFISDNSNASVIVSPRSSVENDIATTSYSIQVLDPILRNSFPNLEACTEDQSQAARHKLPIQSVPCRRAKHVPVIEHGSSHVSRHSTPTSSDDDCRVIRHQNSGKLCRCGKVAQFTCSNCKSALYCGPACQRSAWAEHCRECQRKKMSKQQDPPPTSHHLERTRRRLQMLERKLTESTSRSSN